MENSFITVQAVSGADPMTRVTTRNHTFCIDEPELFNGADQAPSPVEYFLGAIAGCVSAISCQIAKEEGFEIRKLETSVRGEINSDSFLGRSDACRSGFQSIAVELKIDCTADEAQLARWQEQLAVRCPVLDNLLHPARLQILCEREEG